MAQSTSLAAQRVYVPALVGQDLPIRYSFLSLLKNFIATNQSLVSASIVITSNTPTVADFDVGSSGLVTSPKGTLAGISNDAVIARFSILAAGDATMKIEVDAINPAATYVGFFTFEVEDVPTP